MFDLFFRPAALHIPDGFLNLAVSIVFWVLTIVLVGIAVRRTQGELADRQIPLMGIMAAFIFAAQMINFPVAGGTSGHLLGGALAGIVLGPWAGMLVMASVVGIQALLFQDGGLLVMGANIFNMGLITVVIGYGLYKLGESRGKNIRLGLAFGGAWLSVMAGALLTALQLWLSGTTTLNIVIPAMLGVHALIGIGEGLITVGVLTFVARARPELLSQSGKGEQRGWVIAGVLMSLAVVLLSPFASADPDGLERVAEDLGFLNTGLDAPYQVLPDYTLPFLGETGLSTILSGIIGMIIVAGVVVLVVRARGPKTA